MNHYRDDYSPSRTTESGEPHLRICYMVEDFVELIREHERKEEQAARTTADVRV